MGMSSTFKDFPHTAYKISKAALNMLTLQYAHAFADQGFTFTAISPGVSTRIPIHTPHHGHILSHANTRLVVGAD